MVPLILNRTRTDEIAGQQVFDGTMVIVMRFKAACVSFNAFGEEHDWGGGCPVKCTVY